MIGPGHCRPQASSLTRSPAGATAQPVPTSSTPLSAQTMVLPVVGAAALAHLLNDLIQAVLPALVGKGLKAAKNGMAKLLGGQPVGNLTPQEIQQLQQEIEKVEAFAQQRSLHIVADIPRSDAINDFEERGMTVIEGNPSLPISQRFIGLAQALLKDSHYAV